MSIDKKKQATLTLYMDEAKRSEFRLLCTALGISMNELLNNYIDDFLEKNKGVISINMNKASPR